jgi:trafficking protein particle complex subunit 11
MLLPLLSTWYKCAQQLGDMELGVRLLLEMLAHGNVASHFSGQSSNAFDIGTTATDDEPDAIEEDLLAVLKVIH